MTAFDNLDEANKVEEEERDGPIGVVLVSNVIVETDDHDVAQNVAQGVVDELREVIDDEEVTVHIGSTSDHFYPEDYE